MKSLPHLVLLLLQLVIAWTILLVLVTCVQGLKSDETSYELDFLMPDISPKQKDSYLCHGVALNSKRTMYITEIVPLTNSEVVHHMGIAGCGKPGRDTDTWDCNDFVDGDGPLCRGASIPLLMWAKNASALKLPPSVGFKVGGDTEIQYVVMQIHYNNVETFINGGVDHSGVRVKYTFKPLPHTAAIMVLGTEGGLVLPGQEEHFEVACSIDDDIVMHPLAFRTHSHQLGRVSSGYRVRGNEWTEIGRRSPQLPHAFVPANPVPLSKGDVVAVRCTMFNFKDHAVQFGHSNEDEMCFFNILYYTEGHKTLKEKDCLSQGPPAYYWSNDKNLDVSKVPADASIVPPLPNGPASEQPTQSQPGPTEQVEQKRRETLLAM